MADYDLGQAVADRFSICSEMVGIRNRRVADEGMMDYVIRRELEDFGYTGITVLDFLKNMNPRG